MGDSGLTLEHGLYQYYGKMRPLGARFTAGQASAGVGLNALSAIETSKMTGGYVMCVGNHIPWNVTPEGIKRYLDRSVEWAHR